MPRASARLHSCRAVRRAWSSSGLVMTTEGLAFEESFHGPLGNSIQVRTNEPAHYRHAERKRPVRPADQRPSLNRVLMYTSLTVY